MQRKYVFFMLAFSMFAMNATSDTDQGQHQPDISAVKVNPQDPFSGLSPEEQEIRKGPQDEAYLAAMLKGAAAIDVKEKEEISKVNKNRDRLKSKTCSSRGWSGEQQGTVVYYWDHMIEVESSLLREQHAEKANKYRDNLAHIQDGLGNDVADALEGTVSTFKKMHAALTQCARGDKKCYDRFATPSFKKMSSKAFRDNLTNAIFEDALRDSHTTNAGRQGIELLTRDQLEQILKQNPKIALALTQIKAKEEEITEFFEGKKEGNFTGDNVDPLDNPAGDEQ